MSEERQLPEYDPEITPDPIATGIAIGRASPAIDSEVIAFLRDQRLHLHEQFRHLREQLRLRLWEQRMGVFLRVATAIVGVSATCCQSHRHTAGQHRRGHHSGDCASEVHRGVPSHSRGPRLGRSQCQEI